jgi:putative hydrolase of HD superfamily
VPSEAEAAHGLARFLHRVGQLKHVPRTGWLDRGVPAAATESVADHTFRLALLAWLAAADEPRLDRERVLKLALLHDLAEAVTGDLPPYDPAALVDADDAHRAALLNQRLIRGGARATAKRAAEAAAMADLLADLPTALAGELGSLWRELEEGTSPEARFVKQADKLETYLQSREYLADDPTRPMASFAAEVAEVIDAAPLVHLRDAVARLAIESNDVGKEL